VVQTVPTSYSEHHPASSTAFVSSLLTHLISFKFELTSSMVLLSFSMDHLFLSDWCYLLRAWPNFLCGSMYLLHGLPYLLLFILLWLTLLHTDTTSPVALPLLSSWWHYFSAGVHSQLTLLHTDPTSFVVLPLLSSWWHIIMTPTISDIG
jgi:hypothetical protein